MNGSDGSCDLEHRLRPGGSQRLADQLAHREILAARISPMRRQRRRQALAAVRPRPELSRYLPGRRRIPGPVVGLDAHEASVMLIRRLAVHSGRAPSAGHCHPVPGSPPPRPCSTPWVRCRAGCRWVSGRRPGGAADQQPDHCRPTVPQDNHGFDPLEGQPIDELARRSSSP